MINIFIFGSNGMLGNYVKKYLLDNLLNYNIINITRQNYDLINLSVESLNKFLLSMNIKKSDIIINCIGLIPQRINKNNYDKKEYYKINSLFPIILSMIAMNFNTKFIHITTDCVFSGINNNTPYNEESLHDETNDYGISKSLGELCYGTIIRTSIIGEELFNNKSLVEWIKSNSNKEIYGYENHFWNGITCLELSKIIHNIIINDLYWNGIKHIYSPNIISKFNLCYLINDIYKLNIKILKIKNNNYNIINKSITSIYKNIFDIPNIQQQIIDMKNFNIF